MASLADIGALNMRTMLTRCRRTVMTTGTVTRDTRMVEVGRYPGISRMTSLAVSTTLNMCWMLSGRRRSIVTTGAGTDDIGVIHSDNRHPGRISMTVLTHIRGLYMGGMLTRCR